MSDPRPTPRDAFKVISSLHKGKTYDSVTKSDLFEALKWARHVAGVMLRDERTVFDLGDLRDAFMSGFAACIDTKAQREEEEWEAFKGAILNDMEGSE